MKTSRSVLFAWCQNRAPRTLLAIAFLLATAPLAAQEAPPKPIFPTLPEDAPAGTGMMQPCLEGLEGTVRCGRYRVWEDREAKEGRTLDLAFVVADSLGEEADHTTAATWFFGGPGTSVTRPAYPVIEFFAPLRQSRDLLLMDYRGAGNSQALHCNVPYPSGVSSRFGSIFPIDHVEACRDELSKRAQLDLYTSRHNIDDLDELREWLNYETLDLNGGSYGTFEAQIYARRHPQSVRTMVLNGVAPINVRGYVKHARGLQTALERLIAECLGQEKCAAAYPDLEAKTAAVLERVRTDPPEVTAEGETVAFGPGELAYALRGLLYGRAAEVPAKIYGAAAGDWQPLADYYLQRSGWANNENDQAGMHFSVICAEDITRVDPEIIARETEGTFLGDYLIGGYYEVCKVWPHAELEASFWEPVESDIPTLLLSGDRDPVTPPSGGEAVAAGLPNSLHIVVPGAGHGVGGPCIAGIERQFVESGSVEGLDTSCIEARPETEFVIAED